MTFVFVLRDFGLIFLLFFPMWFLQWPQIWICLSIALRRESFTFEHVKYVLVFISLHSFFVEIGGKKEICTANLEHLDVFYSQRCYIPGIYHLIK